MNSVSIATTMEGREGREGKKRKIMITEQLYC
jgi:hypothetical protein